MGEVNKNVNKTARKKIKNPKNFNFPI